MRTIRPAPHKYVKLWFQPDVREITPDPKIAVDNQAVLSYLNLKLYITHIFF
jgi:hypothetical protein